MNLYASNTICFLYFSCRSYSPKMNLYIYIYIFVTGFVQFCAVYLLPSGLDLLVEQVIDGLDKVVMTMKKGQ